MFQYAKGLKVKLAVSGKGGVGKTTFAAFLIKALADEGKRVLAIDADPDANLSQALGIEESDKIIPISEMKDLIEERTGAKPGAIGGFFKLNPRVDDLPDRLSIKIDNIKLMVMGGIKKGGAGCICPESTLLKQLVRHIVVSRDEAVVMDMEAGLEHLGRGTAMFVDRLIVVVEPGRRSIETAFQINRLASDLRIRNISLVGNKIRSIKDEEFLRENARGFDFLCFIPFKETIIEADLNGVAVFDENRDILEMIKKAMKDKIYEIQ